LSVYRGQITASGVCLLIFISPLLAANLDPVQTRYGAVQGLVSSAGVRVFRGIPYAAPPIGPLRWKAPQAPASWRGVRRADAFGPRCMQERVFDDMVFRSPRVSEDCLYLNIWAPTAATATQARYPVLVYFHGGGFVAGDGSEPRYDGESLARRGILVVTPELSAGRFRLSRSSRAVAGDTLQRFRQLWLAGPSGGVALGA
jgi:para-nitrobenzyl esterase